MYSDQTSIPTKAPSVNPAPACRLPFELLEVIAEELVARDWHRTCANLTMASKGVQEQVDPILWKRVVYRWNNVAKKKKGGAKWKHVFMSGSAKYIQFLVIMPISKPDVTLDLNAAKYPFLDAILAQPNRLKALIVTGEENKVGLYLFQRYTPCSSGMWTIMQLTDTARLISKAPCIQACIHPYAKMPASMRDSAIEIVDDMKTLLIEGAKRIPSVEMLEIPPFLGLELVMPPDGIPPYYLKGVIAEILVLVRPTAQLYVGRHDMEDRKMPPMSVRLDFWGMTVLEAMITGEAASVAYALDPAFAAMIFRVRTRETLPKQQARRFTELMEKSYLSTYKDFQRKPPGGVYITDESAGSTIRNPPSSTIDINPFGPVDQVQGILQYLPMGPNNTQAIRAIKVPEEGQSEIELLEMPQL